MVFEMSDSEQNGKQPLGCQSKEEGFEKKTKASGRILGNAHLVQPIWEEFLACMKF